MTRELIWLAIWAFGVYVFYDPVRWLLNRHKLS